MENEVKQRNQRNRRRERAQRMQAQRESKVKDGDSGEDESPTREKPPRPPARRKKSREPLGEEEIIDGFAIMAFRTYEDLEAAVKCASSPRTNALSTKPRLPLPARNHPPNNVNSHGITLLQDAGTSDDSGRASERLTGSSVAPRDPDSSRDRLSDASSRCSSGKGYICDSEGDDDKASPENPRYHDVPMEVASDTGSLFRVTGAAVGGGGGGGKNEMVARGGSGGALALSRAPVGGSASPAPAPLPQPAPSPAPAALPPPALPPPTFRADTPHRPNGAHIPALEGHAATQIPARPVGAAGPDTPERPASNNKLQAGARASADSPTPAPPAPQAPSPLFPSHAAYQSQSQSHAAAALPDYRHTNHETRTEPADPPPAPLDLHAHHAPRPPQPPHPHPHLSPAPQPPPPHPSLQSRVPHDARAPPAPPHASVPTSFPSRTTAATPTVPPHSTTATTPTCLPSQTLPGRPLSPAAPTSRPYPAPAIGSSHVNSNMNSGVHGHTTPYQSQPSLQKHSVQPVYASRPSHLTPFSISNHITPSHVQSSMANQQPTVTHISHPIISHSVSSYPSHVPVNNSNLLSSSTPNHIGPPLSLASTPSTTVSSYAPSLKHPGLSLPQHPIPSIPLAPPSSSHPIVNHVDSLSTSSCTPTVVTPVTSSSSMSHPLAPPLIDSRQVPISSTELPARTQSPIVSSTLASNGYPPPAVYTGTAYPPLYAPYATTLQHSPYLPPAAASPRNTTDTRLAASPLVAPKTPKGVRPHTPGSTGAAGAAISYSPHGQSPSRERESFSSNISSLSRSTPASVTGMAAPAPPLVAPLVAPLAAPLAAPLVTPMPGPLPVSMSGPLPAPLVGGLGGGLALAPLAAPTPTPAAPSAPHLAHSLAPVPTVPSISSGAKPPAHWGVTRPTGSERPSGFAPAPPLFGAPLAPPNPNPFSAESLFQTSPGADLLRRELDSRFLAAAGAAGAGGAGGGVRTEMHHHQHQHQHTHVHQHPPHHAPHPAHHPHHPHQPHHQHQLLVPHQPPPPPLFKDVGKMSSLYRTGLGLGYPYSSSLLHPPGPYAPPAPLTTYAPKPVVSAASDCASKPPPRPAVAKTGKWNAMHVRIAWEIYNHQQKEKSSGGAAAAGDKDKLRAFPGAAPPPPPAATYRSPYDLPSPYLPHHAHLGVSPFARYAPGAYPAPPTFGLPYGRELPLPLHGVHHAPLGALHDAWRARPPPVSAAAVATHAAAAATHAAATHAAATHAAEARRDHEERERERARRERDERERRERDERERRKARDREMERARTRSPLRNGALEPKEERKETPRHAPPPLPYPPPPPWDPYRAFDPLQHMRFAPFVEAAIRAEEDRAKMLSAYAHHQQLKAGGLLHRPHLPLGHAALAHAHAHAPLGHAHAPLAPLAPLDLLKKEEPR